MDNKQKVLDILSKAEKPMRPGDISEKAGIEKTEVDKLIKVLKTEDKIYSPTRCFYSLKK